jgi:hydrogenase expression/formation protein HypC
MCIGFPMRIVSAEGTVALAERNGERHTIDLQRVGEVGPGVWVLAFQNTAVRVISADEASHTIAALAALESALAGGREFDAFFADLVDREPQLPDHLKGTS